MTETSTTETMRLFARNFRGFEYLDIDLSKNAFIVGDNSSGKTTILHLIDYVTRTDLLSSLILDEELHVGRYDVFSPYFSFSDIQIGYHVCNKETNSIRIVDFQRNRQSLIPEEKKISFFLNDRGVTLLKRGQSLFIRAVRFQELNIENAVFEHNKNVGFRKSKLNSDESLFSIALMWRLFKESDLIKRDDFSFFDNVLPSSRHIGPVRQAPSFFYELDRRIKGTGSHFPSMIHDMSKGKINTSPPRISAFGKESGLFDEIRVRKLVSDRYSSPLFVEIIKDKKEFDLTQVGVGISQVAPILVEIEAYLHHLMGSSIFCIQQPELHLHPVAQAALGEYFYNSVDPNMSFFIETHSNYIIDRFRYCMNRDNKTNNSAGTSPFNSANIIFCQSSDSGNIARTIKIDKNGKLINPPEEYNKFFLEELSRTLF